MCDQSVLEGSDENTQEDSKKPDSVIDTSGNRSQKTIFGIKAIIGITFVLNTILAISLLTTINHFSFSIFNLAINRVPILILCLVIFLILIFFVSRSICCELLNDGIVAWTLCFFKVIIGFSFAVNTILAILMLTTLKDYSFSFFNLSFNQPSILILCLTIYLILFFFVVKVVCYSNNDPLKIFEAYLGFNIVAICGIFFSLLAILLINISSSVEFLKQLVSFFEISPNIADSISKIIVQKDLSNLFDISKIAALISIFVIYCSIFSHLRNKGLYALNGSSDQTKYLFFIYQSLLPIFTNFLIPITILYYVFVHPDLIQVFLLIDIFLFARIAIIPLMYSIFNVVNDYPSLEKLNTPSSEKFILPLRNFLDSYIPILQSGIFFISILVILFTVELNFNILSIIYLVLCIFVWFHVISLLSSIPRNKVAFTLLGGFVERNCYITEETSSGDYVVLTPDPNPTKKIRKIFRASLISVEEEEKIKESSSVPLK